MIGGVEAGFEELLSSLLELPEFLSPDFSPMIKPPLDVIYNYTQSLLKEYGEAFTRLDTKISVYIGFSAVLIRLAFDLPHESITSERLRNSICILASLTIALCSVGLLAKPSGNVADPKILMSDEWFFGQSEDAHKAYITNGFIETIDELDTLLTKRRIVLAWVTAGFVITSGLFAAAVVVSS